MIVVAGYLVVDAAERDRYVHAFVGLVERARRSPGCLDLAITADSADPARINTFELWSSQGDLDTFRAQADVPDLNIDIVRGSMKEYVVDHAREPFTTD